MENRGDDMARRGPGPEHFRSTDNEVETHDLVMAAGHEVAVLAALNALGIRFERRERSVDLGLTKVELVPTDRWPAVPGMAGAVGAGDDFVGRVIHAVKRYVDHGIQGAWVPTLGRNRTIAHVTNSDGRPIITAVGSSSGLVEPAAGEADVLPPGPWINPPHGSVEGAPGDGIRIGVVDTVLRPHFWLQGAPLSPVPFPLDGPGPHSFRASHCDAVAGVILSGAPGAIVDVRGIFNDDGVSTTWELAKAIAGLANSGVDLINLSCALYTEDAEPPLALAKAIDLLGSDVLVVAAAGNYANEKPVVIESYDGPVTFDMSVAPAWPAAIDQVVAVGSVGVKDASWVISDFSPSGDWVDAMAPGEHVLSLAIGGVSASPDPSPGTTLAPAQGGFAWWWGTSISTAAVTAMIARNMRDGESARAAWDRLIAGRPRIKGSGISPGPVLVLPAP
jgi:hypothetical protein